MIEFLQAIGSMILLFFIFFIPYILGGYLGYLIEKKKTKEERLQDNIETFNRRYKTYKEKMKNYDYYIMCKQNEWHLSEGEYREYKYLRDYSVKKMYEEFKIEEQKILERYNDYTIQRIYTSI